MQEVSQLMSQSSGQGVGGVDVRSGDDSSAGAGECSVSSREACPIGHVAAEVCAPGKEQNRAARSTDWLDAKAVGVCGFYL